MGLDARRLAACLALSLAACEGEGVCEEDIRAQTIPERLEVSVGALVFEAELADEAVERERGWKHRLCAREAILLVPDQPATPLPVWGCALTGPIDAALLVGGEVLAVERIEPCPEPCPGACPLVGEGLPVDAVLEVPASALAGVEPGDPASF